MSKPQLCCSIKNHIVRLYERKYTAEQIAEIHEISKKTVYNVINRYNETKSTERKTGSGKKIDENLWLLIKNILDDANEASQSLSLSEVSLFLLTNYNIKCSKSTIYDYLVKYDYVNKEPIKKPILIEKHLNDRENWGIFYQFYDWSKVIWSDETMICTQANIKSKIWINKDETKIRRVVKNPLKIHIWGCIFKNHKLIIHICDERLNSDNYTLILESKLQPLLEKYNRKNNDKLLFQQDNAPCHTSYKMCKYFSENNIEVMFWPPCSPDLNPIENVWHILKRLIGKKIIKNKQELIDVIIAKVREIKISTINKIINSMDNRIEQLFQNNFDYINY